jgi:hypothetical protein
MLSIMKFVKYAGNGHRIIDSNYGVWYPTDIIQITAKESWI